MGDPISFHDLQYCSTISETPYFLLTFTPDLHTIPTYLCGKWTIFGTEHTLYIEPYMSTHTCTHKHTHTHTTTTTLFHSLYSWHPHHQVVRHRGGLQCAGDGAAGAQSRGPLQLLWAQVQSQDSVATGRPAGETLTDTRIHLHVTLGLHNSSSLFYLWLL